MGGGGVRVRRDPVVSPIDLGPHCLGDRESELTDRAAVVGHEVVETMGVAPAASAAVLVVVILFVIGGGRVGRDRGLAGGRSVGFAYFYAATVLRGVHLAEVDPGGGREGSVELEGLAALAAVALAELLDLVAALYVGLGRGGAGEAAIGDVVGDILPVGGAEVAATQGVPLVTVGADEGKDLLVGPNGGGQPAGGGGGGQRWRERRRQGKQGSGSFRRGGR